MACDQSARPYDRDDQYLLLDPIDDQHAISTILDVPVHLRPELHFKVFRRLFHLRSCQPKHRDALWDPFNYCLSDGIVPTHHTIQHAMRLDMIQWHSLSVEKALECPNLVYGDRGKFFRLELHFTTAETLEVRESRMCADSDVMRFAAADGGLHDEWVARVEAAGNVGLGDVREEFFVWTLKSLSAHRSCANI